MRLPFLSSASWSMLACRTFSKNGKRLLVGADSTWPCARTPPRTAQIVRASELVVREKLYVEGSGVSRRPAASHPAWRNTISEGRNYISPWLRGSRPTPTPSSRSPFWGSICWGRSPSCPRPSDPFHSGRLPVPPGATVWFAEDSGDNEPNACAGVPLTRCRGMPSVPPGRLLRRCHLPGARCWRPRLLLRPIPKRTARLPA